jgi:hypothetical protein
MTQQPANPMQSAAFLRHQSAPVAPGANIQVSISFGESVNADFLRHAWQVVAARHPILRSAFIKSAEGVMVRIAAKAEPHWIDLDWTNVPPAEIPDRWAELQARDAGVEFEAIAVPLLRFHRIMLPDGASHHLLTFPSFLLDEYSISRVLLDLLLTLGQSPLKPAGEQPLQEKPRGWRKFLVGAQAPLVLDPRFGDHSAVRATMMLPREAGAAFSAFCLDHDLEESVVVRNLWALLLRRFGGAGNVVMSLFDGRGECAEAGYFSNMLPVVQKWRGSVREWLADAQHLNDMIAENVWITPDEALESAELDFTSSDPAATFAWRGATLNDTIHTALPRWINFDGRPAMPNLPGLVLEARPGPRLELSLTGPFTREAAAKEVLARLCALVIDLPSLRDKPVNRLPVLLPDEVVTLRGWSRGPVCAAPGPTLAEAFHAVAFRHPESPAVVFGDYTMSYAELDALSTRFAGHLVEAGFAGGWHIGLVLNPSAWIAVAMIGAWKAGNSCLALDPTAPRDWIEQTLAAHDAAVVVCDAASSPLADPTHRRRVVIDEEWESLETAPLEAGRADENQLAASIPGHVDGDPPMVRGLTHGMLLTSSAAAAELLDFRPGDSFLVRSMPGGGAFFDEWLVPLLGGGTAHVAAEDLLESTTAPVTHLRLTSPEWANQAASWQREPNPASPTLRVVVVEAGSPLGECVALWREHCGDLLRQIVFFSPAGLCGMGVAGELRPGAGPRAAGMPTAEVEVLVCDEDGLDLPAGYAGEVFMKFPGWKNLPESRGRRGFQCGLRGWRDGKGRLHLEGGEAPAPGIPTRSATQRLRPLFGKALDLFDGAVPYALSNSPVQGAVALKEWLLTRGGWIDAQTLPRQRPPARSEGESPSPEPTPEDAPRPRVPTGPWKALTRLVESASGEPLVLVHPGSGSPDDYAGLVEAVGTGRPVLAFTARGLDNPDACHHAIESAAAEYIAALFEEERPDGSQLAGFGFGAIVALEMARQLRAAGRIPPRVVLIGAMPPRSSHRAPGLLASVKGMLKRFASAPRMEPWEPDDEVFLHHEEAWSHYRFEPLDLEATIVMPSDMPSDTATRWLELLPRAVVEPTKCAWAEMLSVPGVKRVASILNSRGEGFLL